MKILIYTTHRTGSTSLANFLMAHYQYNYFREWYFKDVMNLNKPNKLNNVIIKLTPNEKPYNDIKLDFDKRIILTRDNIRNQAESRVYADIIEKHHKNYSITDTFLEEYKLEINNMMDIIQEENILLKKCDDCIHLTYEELYYSNVGLEKLEAYLDTKFKFKLDSSKKYRDMRKTLI